jgi:hypothetical protein
VSDGAIDPEFLRQISHKLGDAEVARQLADPNRKPIYGTCAACGEKHELKVDGRLAVPIEIRAGMPMWCDCGAEGILTPDEGGGWILVQPPPPELGGTHGRP